MIGRWRGGGVGGMELQFDHVDAHRKDERPGVAFNNHNTTSYQPIFYPTQAHQRPWLQVPMEPVVGTVCVQ